MKKLREMIENQIQLVKYYEDAKTRTEKLFYKESIDEVEELINKTRKELGL